MEQQVMIWVTIFIGIGLPFLGWIFKNLISRDVEDLKKENIELKKNQAEDRELFFKRLDEDRKIVESDYVRLDLYKQAKEFHEKEIDAKFGALVKSMTDRFEHLEEKMDDLKESIDKLNNRTNKGG